MLFDATDDSIMREIKRELLLDKDFIRLLRAEIANDEVVEALPMEVPKEAEIFFYEDEEITLS